MTNRDRTLIQARFVFPFRLSLPDSGWFTPYKGKPTMIRVWSGEGDLSYILRSIEDRPESPERYSDRVVSRGEEETIVRTVCVNPLDDLFLEEVVDRVGFTRCDVTFEVAEQVNPEDQERMNELLNDAFERAQYFVRSYRLEASNELDVRVPSISDSPVIQMSASTDYRFNQDEVSGEFKIIWRRLQWPPSWLSGLLKRQLPDEKIKLFRLRLKSGAEPELYLELLLEARELSRIFNRHSVAVVVAQNGFEVFVQRRLIDECRDRNIKVLEDPEGKETDARRAIERGSLIQDLLERFARQLVGHSVKDCPEYHKWRSRAYDLRNAIVHRGRHTLSEADAQAAFEAIVNYIGRLNLFFIESKNQAE